MGPHMVVVAPPVFQRQTGLHQRREQGLVQELVAQAAVEAFDEGVLHGLARCNVVPPDLGLVGPAQNGVAGQLRAVVADDRPGPAARADQKIKFPRDPRPDSEVSATAARHSRVQSSKTARMRKRRPQAN